MGTNATAVGDAVWSASGGHDGNGAFDLDGNGDYLDAGAVFPVGSSYSKTAWVYRASDGVATGHLNIMSSDSQGDSGNPEHVLWVSTANDLHLAAGHGGDREVVEDPAVLEIGEWYHVAVTWDMGSGDMVLYKNGAVVDTGNTSTGVTQTAVEIGSFANQYVWHGSIDDARLYPVALSADQIASIYANGETTMVAAETDDGEVWRCTVTPYSTSEAGTAIVSNTLPVGPSGPDLTDPEVTITTPGDGAIYGLNAVVNADYVCTDAGGSGLASCVGTVADGAPINTSTEGLKSFTVVGTDNASNETTVTHEYTVSVDAVPIAENVVLSSAPAGGGLVSDDLSCAFDLAGTATTAAAAWTLDGSPIATLALPMEGGATAALEDISGNNNDAAIAGNPVWSATGGHDGNGAWILDGNGDDLHAGEIFPTMSSYTKTAWVYRTGSGENGGNNIISGDANSGGHAFWAPDRHSNHLSAGHNQEWDFLEDSVPLALNTWYHVAVTFDYATGEMVLYKNGAIIDSGTIGPMGPEPTGTAVRNVTDATVSIGSFGVSNGWMWQGTLDDARVYPAVLSPAQIASLYSAGETTIVSNETSLGDEWRCTATPYSATAAGTPATSNPLTIVDAVPGDSIIATADNAMDMWINGTYVGTLDNWQEAMSVVRDLEVDDVIAVHATDSEGQAAFIAEIDWDGSTWGSDPSWKVSTTAETGWATMGFDDSGWAQATSYGQYGVAPWMENVSGFPADSSAHWIWSTDYLGDDEVYLRYTVGTPAAPTDTIVGSADNVMDLYVNGELVASSAVWETASAVWTDLSVGDVVAVHAADSEGQAAFIAEINSADAGLAVSDPSWKVSTTLETDWEIAGFDDSGWDQATTYGTYGAWPWGKNVEGFPTDSSAHWIWTDDYVGDNEVYLRHVVGTPPAPSESIVATGDNAMDLYLNGSLVASSADWETASVVWDELADGDVIAVHASDANDDLAGLGAFVAEVNWDGGKGVTDTSWKVSTTLETDWETQGYDDSGWAQATLYGAYGVAPWGQQVANFPTDSAAHWIWSDDNEGDDDVYLRYTIGTPPAPTDTIVASADNVMDLYVNGALVASSADWTVAPTVRYDLSDGDIIAVHAVDADDDVASLAGFIAQIDWDGNTALTDASWKVSTTEEADWATPGFDDSAWAAATSYGAYGVAPWNWMINGFPSASAAEWIWSADNEGDDEVYLRAMLGTAPPEQAFNVFMDELMVQAYQWADGEDVTLMVQHPASGGGWDTAFHSETVASGVAPWDSSQTVAEFVIPDSVVVGDLVTVSGDGITKEHVVVDVSFVVDVDDDEVSGTGSPSADINVGIHDDPGAYRHEVADASTGAFVADFSESGDESPEEDTTYDITAGTSGNVSESDEDGDQTTYYFGPPPNHFVVDPVSDQVWGHEWASGATITVTIAGGAGSPWTETADVDGNFGLDLSGVYDVVADDVVEVTDGDVTKTHAVTALELTGVNDVADTVTGLAALGSSVWVNIHGSGVDDTEAVADAGTGVWVATFTDQIEPDTQGYAYQPDDDGDSTQIQWPEPPPSNQFAVDPVSDQVWGWGWPADGSVTVQVDTDDVPGNGMDEWPGVPVDSDGNFHLDLMQAPAFDVLPGHHVRVIDEALADPLPAKATVVLALMVDVPVDVGDTVVSGTANSANGDVWVGLHVDMYEPDLAVFSNGDWSATLSQSIEFGVNGSAWQDEPVDFDGDRTEVVFGPAQTAFMVDPVSDQVWGHEWASGATITVTIAGGAGSPWTETADVDGNFGLDLSGVYDVVADDVVEVTDGDVTKTHAVTALELTGVNDVADTVTGLAALGSSVWVNIHGSGVDDTEAVADAGTGVWVATFTDQIEPDTQGYAYQPDDDGDSTQIQWPEPPPSNQFAVDPVSDQVWGWGWPADGSVTVQVDTDDVPGNGMDEWPGVPVDSDGNFHLDLMQAPAFDVLPGHHVRVIDEALADPLPAKATVVLALMVDVPVDVGDTVVSGTANSANGDVWVGLHVDMYEPDLAVFSNGDWSATLSQSIEFGVNGSAWQDEPVDFDGDRTEVVFGPAQTAFMVDPVSDQVWGHEWASGATITVTIAGGAGSPWTETADVDGNFGLDLSGVYDVVADDVVEVTDGDVTKTHAVTALELTGVNDVADTVTGLAALGSSVWVNIHGSGVDDTEAVADAGTGVWVATFTDQIEPDTQGYAYQPDDDGDSTQIQWPEPPPSNQFAVDPVSDQVWGWGWPADGSVTVQVDTDDVPGNGMDEWPGVPVDSDGNFHLDLMQAPAFDVLPGHHVRVIDEALADPLPAKATVVLALMVDVPVDVGDTVVSGTANSANGDVWVGLHVDMYEPDLAVFSNGDWSATLSQSIEFGVNGSAWQDEPVDFDGDRTEVVFGPAQTAFMVDPVSDQVWGHEWASGATITVTIAGGAGSPWTETADVDGNFGLDLSGVYDVVADDVVEVTDGDVTKTHAVTALELTGVNDVADTVTGLAALGSSVWVNIHGSGVDDTEAVADAGTGVWVATFTDQIEPDTQGYAYQPDDDGDSTQIQWPEPAPLVENVVLSSSPVGDGDVGDDLSCAFDLTGTASTSATVWSVDGSALATLVLPMEGGAAVALEDVSGNNNDVAPYGDPVWVADGGHDSNGAFVFDGNDDLHAEGVFPTGSSYTKTAWVYRTGSGLNGGNNIISGDTNGGGHAFWARDSLGNRLSAGHNGTWDSVIDSEALPTGAWFHVAVTWDSSTGLMSLYKNGALVSGSGAVPTATITTPVTDATVSIGSFGGRTGLCGRARLMIRGCIGWRCLRIRSRRCTTVGVAIRTPSWRLRRPWVRSGSAR